MGLFDRARKLAEQAVQKVEDATQSATGSRSGAPDGAGGAVRAGHAGPAGAPPPAPPGRPADPGFGTPYVPGQLGRPGWREQDLPDPAAMLPAASREAAGIPRSTRSEVVEEPYGMGRRWTGPGDRSAGLFYALYPDHEAAAAAVVKEPFHAGQRGDLGGRTGVFLPSPSGTVVIEASGLDDTALAALTEAVARQLT